MKIALTTLLLLVLTGLTVLAQQDTTYHRKIYADINGRLAEFGSNTVKIQRAGAPEKTAVKVWFEASIVRKVVLTETQGPTYTRTTEFYYNPEQALTFVFMTDKEGKTVQESRMYFSKSGEKMIKWLAGKEEIPVASHVFRDFGVELIRTSNEILSQVGD